MRSRGYNPDASDLVEDAAGHVKVTPVGGIVTGFRFARRVAEAILNGGSSGKRPTLRLELNTHLLIRVLIRAFTLAHYSYPADLLNTRARTDLEADTRDEPGGVVWCLYRYQPRLLLLALRSFLRCGGFPGDRMGGTS